MACTASFILYQLVVTVVAVVTLLNYRWVLDNKVKSILIGWLIMMMLNSIIKQ